MEVDLPPGLDEVLAPLRYLPAAELLLPALERAVDADGHTLGDRMASRGLSLASLTGARVRLRPVLDGEVVDAQAVLLRGDRALVSVAVVGRLTPAFPKLDGAGLATSRPGWVTWRHDLWAWRDDLGVPSPPHRITLVLSPSRPPARPDLVRAREEAAALLRLSRSSVSVFGLGLRSLGEIALAAWEARRGRADAEPCLRGLSDIVERLTRLDLAPRERLEEVMVAPPTHLPPPPMTGRSASPPSAAAAQEHRR